MESWLEHFYFPNSWDDDPIWLSYFSLRLKPPTRLLLIIIIHVITIYSSCFFLPSIHDNLLWWLSLQVSLGRFQDEVVSHFQGFPGPKPIGSMYGIYANIWGIWMVNATIYSIHGSYGKGGCFVRIPPVFVTECYGKWHIVGMCYGNIYIYIYNDMR